MRSRSLVWLKSNYGLWTEVDGGSGLRVNEGTDVKFSTVGWCLLFVFDWAHRGSS